MPSPSRARRTDDRGATAVEYAIYVALVALAMIGGVVALQVALGATLTAAASDPVITGDPAPVAPQAPAPEAPAPEAPAPEAPAPEAPAAPPGSPTSVSADANRTSLTVTWSEPADNGGAPIARYSVAVGRGSTCTDASFVEDASTSVSTATTATLSDLAPGAYCVKVRAAHASGQTSAWATAGTFTVTGAVAPTAPTGLTVQRTGTGELTARWTASADDGGATAAYEVEWESEDSQPSSCSTVTINDGSATTSATSRVIGSLSSTKWYCVRVRATTTAGTSAWAYAAPVRAGASAPGAPTGLSVERTGSGQITATWTAPADTGGADVSYDVEWESESSQPQDCSDVTINDDDASTTATSTVIGSLSSTKWYCVRVRATNTAGDSAWVYTGPVRGGTGSVPGAPSNLRQVAETKTTIDLDWDAPTSDGGSEVTDYVIEVRVSGTSEWTVVNDGRSSTTARNVSGLTKDTRYDFRVAAVTDQGQGAYSNVLTHRTDD